MTLEEKKQELKEIINERIRLKAKSFKSVDKYEKLATELLICIETIEALGLASKDSLSMRHARRTLAQLTNGDGEWYER